MKGKSICFLVTKPKEIYNRTVWKEDLKSVQGDLQIHFISYTFTKGIKKNQSFYSKKKVWGGHNDSLPKIYKKTDLRSHSPVGVFKQDI